MTENIITSSHDTLQSSETEFVLPFRIKEFPDEKNYYSFIKNVERLVRTSPEYRLWLSYVKDVLGNNYCLITNETNEDVTVEIHHVIGLFELVMMVVDTRIMNAKEFSSFDVAEEVMGMHFKNQVAYVPLVTTLHEKVHNGGITIPVKMVFGNWPSLLTTYYLNDEIKKKIEKLQNSKVGDIAISWKKDFYPGVINQLETESKQLENIQPKMF